MVLPGWNTNRFPCCPNVMLAKIPTDNKVAEIIIKVVYRGVKIFLYKSGFTTRKYRFMAVNAIIWSERNARKWARNPWKWQRRSPKIHSPAIRDPSDNGMQVSDMVISLTASVKTNMFVTDRRWLFLIKAMQRSVFPKNAARFMMKRGPTSATTWSVERFIRVLGKFAGATLGWDTLASIANDEFLVNMQRRDCFVEDLASMFYGLSSLPDQKLV